MYWNKSPRKLVEKIVLEFSWENFEIEQLAILILMLLLEKI
jgi:hypothetical protein